MRGETMNEKIREQIYVTFYLFDSQKYIYYSGNY